VNDNLLVTGKAKEITIMKKMIIQEKKMKISQAYRTDSTPQEPKSALRGLMQRLGLTLLACTLAISATQAQQAPNGTTQAAPPISGVIGKVQSFTGSSVDVQTPSGVVHLDVKQPLTTYQQIPSDLSHVTSASYVGVASTEQADGTTTHSRMTNGSVSRPAVSHSRMTNGTVQKGSGTTLVVQYQDGSKTISVPANVPVTAVAPEKVTFTDGDVVYATTEKLPDGTLVTDKIFQFIPAASSDTKQ
jgi:hypothetical protein